MPTEALLRCLNSPALAPPTDPAYLYDPVASNRYPALAGRAWALPWLTHLGLLDKDLALAERAWPRTRRAIEGTRAAGRFTGQPRAVTAHEAVLKLLGPLVEDLKMYRPPLWEWPAVRDSIEGILQWRLASADLEDLKAEIEWEASRVRDGGAAPDYVTLDMIALMLRRSKKTLERLKTRKANPLPAPDIEGGGGRSDEWAWAKVRDWLATEFKRPDLPARFPSLLPSPPNGH